MPLIQLPGGRWKFGKHGKTYSGKDAREKARKQGAAISIDKARRKGYNIPIKGDSKKRGTIRRL